MYEHEPVSLRALGYATACSFMYASLCVYVFACLQLVQLCVCLYICMFHLSHLVYASRMCLRVLNLSGPRLPEAGFLHHRYINVKAGVCRNNAKHDWQIPE